MNKPAKPARGSRIVNSDSDSRPRALGAGQPSTDGGSGPQATDLMGSAEAGGAVQSAGEEDEEYEPL
jgi:hypothetical protein